jgi:hypothetical protein
MISMRVVVAVASVLLAPLGAAEQQSARETAAPATVADEASTVMAVWVQKEVDFPYKGLTSYYTCDGIRDKVRAILKYVGARPGFKVTVRSCVNDFSGSRNLGGVETMPWVYITAALPQPVTPELLAELAKPDPKAELIARATGKPSVKAEATAQFPAQWRRVQFLGKPTGPVQLGDCELMDEMAAVAFAQLGARVVEDLTSCVPRQVNPGSIRLTLEVLQPVPEK